jgi:hypothetical protein
MLGGSGAALINGDTSRKIEDKICACIDCSRSAVHHLTIIYLNKTGWFCDQCRDTLISEGLVVLDSSNASFTIPAVHVARDK